MISALILSTRRFGSDRDAGTHVLIYASTSERGIYTRIHSTLGALWTKFKALWLALYQHPNNPQDPGLPVPQACV